MNVIKRIIRSFGVAEPLRDLRPATALDPDEPHARLIEEWMEQKTGKPLDEVTTQDVLDVPRPDRLRYAPLVSPLGGRLDAHLRHLTSEEAADLERRGDAFLEATSVEPDPR